MSLLWEQPAAPAAHRLRPYQETAVARVLKEWETEQSTLLVMATGLGKTQVFSEVIGRGLKSMGGRALVLAHRQELIDQAAARIQKVCGLRCGIEMGDRWADMRDTVAPVIVSSVQTQNAGRSARMERFNPHDFSVLVIDESHHAVSDSYRRTVAHYRQNPSLRILGVTATPDRADEEALGQIFTTTAYVHEINDGISEGWLVPILQRSVAVEGLDFSGLRTDKSDLHGGELAALMEEEEESHGLVSSSLDLVGERQTIIFASSVRHGEMIRDILNRHRTGCARFVEGRTEPNERRRIFEDYAARGYQFLVNVGVVTEGVDVPGIEVVVMGRPTKSRSLYAQMVGRGTRPLPGLVDGVDGDEARRNAIAASGKPHLEVIDFVGNAGRHHLISTADILGGKYTEQEIEAAQEIMQQAESPQDAMKVLRDVRKAAEEKAAREAAQEAERQRRAHVKGLARFSTSVVDAFNMFDLAPPQAGLFNAKEVATEAQVRHIATLSKGGIDGSGISKADAARIIEELKNRKSQRLCSYKMAKQFKRLGFPTDITMEKGLPLLQAIRDANWRRPPADVVNAILYPQPAEMADIDF